MNQIIFGFVGLFVCLFCFVRDAINNEILERGLPACRRVATWASSRATWLALAGSIWPRLARSGCSGCLGWLDLAVLVAPGRSCWLDQAALDAAGRRFCCAWAVFSLISLRRGSVSSRSHWVPRFAGRVHSWASWLPHFCCSGCFWAPWLARFGCLGRSCAPGLLDLNALVAPGCSG